MQLIEIEVIQQKLKYEDMRSTKRFLKLFSVNVIKLGKQWYVTKSDWDTALQKIIALSKGKKYKRTPANPAQKLTALELEIKQDLLRKINCV